jgi:hypothetical protein
VDALWTGSPEVRFPHPKLRPGGPTGRGAQLKPGIAGSNPGRAEQMQVIAGVRDRQGDGVTAELCGAEDFRVAAAGGTAIGGATALAPGDERGVRAGSWCSPAGAGVLDALTVRRLPVITLRANN